MANSLPFERDSAFKASTASPFMLLARAFRRGRSRSKGGEKVSLLSPAQEVPPQKHLSCAPQSPLDVSEEEGESEAWKGIHEGHTDADLTNDECNDRQPLFRASLVNLVGSLEAIDITNTTSRTIDAELDPELLVRLASKARDVFLSEETLLQVKVCTLAMYRGIYQTCRSSLSSPFSFVSNAHRPR
jgi:hypothetical protein